MRARSPPTRPTGGAGGAARAPRRFPYVSSELLSCDVSQLHEAIGSEQCAPHLRTLLHFPEAAGPLNPVLIGYYGKVVSALFKRAPHNFLETLDAHAHGGRHGYLKMLLGHLDLQSVADLLATLTAPLEAQGAPPPPPMMLGGLHAREPPRQAGPAEPDADEEPEQWLDGPEFACMLLDAVLGSSSAEVHALAATLFAGLVGHYGWGAMVAHLPLVAGLVEVALEAPAQSARTCGLCMLTELLRLHAFERASVEDEGEAARRDAQLAPLVAALGEQIEGFVAQLNVEPVRAPPRRAGARPERSRQAPAPARASARGLDPRAPHRAAQRARAHATFARPSPPPRAPPPAPPAAGAQVLPSHLETFLHSGGFADSLQVMPVGSARIARYAFLAKLLPYCDGEACLALVECRLLEIALDAFGRYACNNALHTHVTALVLFALKEEAPAELTHALLSEARLASRLAAFADAGAAPRADEDPAVAAADSSDPAPAAPARAPNFGHVLVMANALVAAEERSEAVRAALATDAAWRAFVDGPLAAANANERLTLGGQVRPHNARASRAARRGRSRGWGPRLELGLHRRAADRAPVPAPPRAARACSPPARRLRTATPNRMIRTRTRCSPRASSTSTRWPPRSPSTRRRARAPASLAAATTTATTTETARVVEMARARARAASPARTSARWSSGSGSTWSARTFCTSSTAASPPSRASR